MPCFDVDTDPFQHLRAKPNIILVLHLIPADQFLDAVVESIVVGSEPLSPKPELFMQHPQNGCVDFGDVFSVVLRKLLLDLDSLR